MLTGCQRRSHPVLLPLSTLVAVWYGASFALNYSRRNSAYVSWTPRYGSGPVPPLFPCVWRSSRCWVLSPASPMVPDHRVANDPLAEQTRKRQHLVIVEFGGKVVGIASMLSLIHISEPTRLRRISYAVFCLK